MKCISQNVIGNIFVSNKVINKTIEFDFININNGIKLKNIDSKITSDDDLYVEAALPRYEEGINYLKNLHIGHNEWVDSLNLKIGMLTIELGYEEPYVNVNLDDELTKYKAELKKSEDSEKLANSSKSTAEILAEKLQKAIAIIDAVFNDADLSEDDKISKLAEIESSANMTISRENKKIEKLKEEIAKLEK